MATDARGRNDPSLSIFPMVTVKRTTMATQRVCVCMCVCELVSYHDIMAWKSFQGVTRGNK